MKGKDESNAKKVVWTPEALEKMQKAPHFLRERVKKYIEERALKEGVLEITSQYLSKTKNSFMSKFGGFMGGGK